MKKLTDVQVTALRKYAGTTGGFPNSLGVRSDVAWRLVECGYLTSKGLWAITPSGMQALAELDFKV